MSVTMLVVLTVNGAWQGQGKADNVLPFGTPTSSMIVAALDCSKLPTEAAQHARYLSLYNFAAAERLKLIPIVSGHCNLLSRTPDLTPVYIVPNCDGSLVRVDLRDYRWSPETWEQLSDPYFSIQVSSTVDVVIYQALKPGDKWDGRPWVWADGTSGHKAGAFTVKDAWPAVTEKRKVPDASTTQALAPWLTETPEGRNAVESLARMTGSRMPVVRADWFVNQTAAAADRTPNYYDFLGVKDETTFQRAIGADLKLATEFGAELREAVAISGVTLNPRAIARHGTIGGGYWRTFDFSTVKKVQAGGTGSDKVKPNPLKTLGRDVEADYDATEQFGNLPNGLWATGLFDRAGKVQATAPDNIASDGFARGNDRRVHAGISCFRCHADGGIQPIDGWVRNLLQPPFNVLTPDYERRNELRRQYARKLEPFISKDRLVYETAIKEVTGLDSKKFAAAYASLWEHYEDGRIDLARAATELGVTKEKFRAALMLRLKANYGDLALSALLSEGQRPRAIPVRQWEESYSDAQAIVRGVQPLQQEK